MTRQHHAGGDRLDEYKYTLFCPFLVEKQKLHGKLVPLYVCQLQIGLEAGLNCKSGPLHDAW